MASRLTNVSNQLSRRVGKSVVAALCLTFAVATWWSVAAWLPTATWVVAALPAAFVGLSIGSCFDGWSLRPVYAAVWVAGLAGTATFLVGDYMVFATRMQHLLDDPKVREQSDERLFFERIASLQRKRATPESGEMPTPKMAEEAKTTAQLHPANTSQHGDVKATSANRKIAARFDFVEVYVDSVRPRWWQILIGIAVSAFVATFACRIATVGKPKASGDEQAAESPKNSLED